MPVWHVVREKTREHCTQLLIHFPGYYYLNRAGCSTHSTNPRSIGLETERSRVEEWRYHDSFGEAYGLKGQSPIFLEETPARRPQDEDPGHHSAHAGASIAPSTISECPSPWLLVKRGRSAADRECARGSKSQTRCSRAAARTRI